MEGGALGYDFSNMFDISIRTELKFFLREIFDSNYNLKTLSNGKHSYARDTENKIKLNTLMLNTYYDFKTESSFILYLSVGLGYVRVNQKTTLSNEFVDAVNPVVNNFYSDSISRSSNNFAWSVGAGVKYVMNNDFDIDFSDRYLEAGKASTSFRDALYDFESKVKVSAHDLMLGGSYKF